MLKALIDKDEKRAYDYFLKLYQLSEESEELLPYVKELATLLNNPNSYVATRAFLLLIRQFRHLDLNEYYKDLYDYVHRCKGIALRQAIKGVYAEINFSPELIALFKDIEAENYSASMASLIKKDLAKLSAIRKMSSDEYFLLEDYTYEAIFVQEGMAKPDRSILEEPALKLYYQDFGKGEDDLALVACVGLYVVGACWCRKIKDYGYISDDIPSLAIAVNADFRGLGLGTKLLEAMFKEAVKQGYSALSLSVQRLNPAFKLYSSLGFKIYRQSPDEIVMIKELGAEDE